MSIFDKMISMEFYHLINRGVDKKITFPEDSDCVRFMHDLYVFNDVTNVDSNHRFHEFQSQHVRRPLVEIHAFCLMPNHYHILVSELEDNGISFFMRKINMGYAKYFNEKYDRSGVLWQGTFKRIRIERDAHFLYIPYYIHLNPLDLTHPEWRDGSISDMTSAMEYLKKYRWSSFLDYLGQKNFPSIITKEILSENLGTAKNQEKTIQQIVSNADLVQGSSSIE